MVLLIVIGVALIALGAYYWSRPPARCPASFPDTSPVPRTST
jgi:hypothetical protein